MEPITHILLAVLPVLAYSLLRYQRLTTGSMTLVVIFAALFPDLVDKPLAWWLGVIPSGRMLTHSVLVAIPIILGVLIFTYRSNRLSYGIGFSWGYFAHIAADFYPIIYQGRGYYWYPNMFWPYMDPNPDPNPDFGYHFPFGVEFGYELAAIILLIGYVAYDIRRRHSRNTN